MPLKLPKRYGKMVPHKRRPRQVKKAFSKNANRVVQVNPDGSYTTQSRLNGRTTKYTKTGRVKKRQ